MALSCGIISGTCATTSLPRKVAGLVLAINDRQEMATLVAQVLPVLRSVKSFLIWARRSMRQESLLFVFIAVAISFGSPARAQITDPSGRPIDFQKDGIRFEIKASIKAMPGSPHVKSDDDTNRASLEVKLRISAHATESRFFGVKSATFSDFRLAEGSEEKVFLLESRCHQRRGLPKVTVVAIDGSIQTDKGRVDVAARPRQLGRVLPPDEISAGARQPNGADKIGPFVGYASQTSASRLSVNVKIYTIDCPLAASTQ